VQPFERLRSLARWGSADDELLVEIAACLAEFDDDPAGLVVACRRLLDHHRTWAQLWWLCARVLGAPQSATAATRVLDEISRDATATRVASALPFPAVGPVALLGWPAVGAHLVAERPDLTLRSVPVEPWAECESPPVAEIDHDALDELRPSHLLVEPIATGPGRTLLPRGGATVVDTCPVATRIWLVTPVGLVLPERLLDALAAAADLSEFVAPGCFDRVVGPRGLAGPDTLGRRVDAPVAPELLRPLP